MILGDIMDKKKVQFDKLSIDDEDHTKIMAGQVTYTIKQLEDEINMDSELGHKLKQIESELEKY